MKIIYGMLLTKALFGEAVARDINCKNSVLNLQTTFRRHSVTKHCCHVIVIFQGIYRNRYFNTLTYKISDLCQIW
jgi:hypothetical protein